MVKDYKRGYVRQLSAEYTQLRAQLIISTDHAGPKMAVEQIRKSGVKFEEFSSQYSVEGTQGVIRKVGKLLGEEQKAEAMVQDIGNKVTEAKSLSRGLRSLRFSLSMRADHGS